MNFLHEAYKETSYTYSYILYIGIATAILRIYHIAIAMGVAYTKVIYGSYVDPPTFRQ